MGVYLSYAQESETGVSMYEIRCIDGTKHPEDLTCAILFAEAERNQRYAHLYIANAERHLHFKWGMGYYVVKK